MSSLESVLDPEALLGLQLASRIFELPQILENESLFYGKDSSEDTEPLKAAAFTSNDPLARVLHDGAIDKHLKAKLAHDSKRSPFRFFVCAYDRARMEADLCSGQAIVHINECKRKIAACAGDVLAGTFGVNQPARCAARGTLQLLDSIDVLHGDDSSGAMQLPPGFLEDMVDVLDEKQLAVIFQPIMQELACRVQRCSPMGSFSAPLGIVRQLMAIDGLLTVLVQMPTFLPELKINEGYVIEQPEYSWLGPLFSPSPIPDERTRAMPAVDEMLITASLGTNPDYADPEQVMLVVRGNLDQLHTELSYIMQELLAEPVTKPKMIAWLRSVLAAHPGPNNVSLPPPPGSASHGFLINLGAVMVKLSWTAARQATGCPDRPYMEPEEAGPMCEGQEMVYMLTDGHDRTANPSLPRPSVSIRHESVPSSAAPGIPPTEAPTVTSSHEYRAMSELFFITMRSLQLGVIALLESYMLLVTEMEDLQRAEAETGSQRVHSITHMVSAPGQPPRNMAWLDRQRMCMEALMNGTSCMQYSIAYYNMMSGWFTNLTRAVVTAPGAPIAKLPLPPPPVIPTIYRAVSQYAISVVATEQARRKRMDFYKCLGVGMMLAVVLALVLRASAPGSMKIIMGLVFFFGYVTIVVEEFLNLNRAGVALVMGMMLWMLQSDIFNEVKTGMDVVGDAINNAIPIILFLMGGMLVTELISLFNGFQIITRVVRLRNKKMMLAFVSMVAFCLGAVMEDIVVALVVLPMLNKLCPEDLEARKYYGVAVVVGANLGGSWSVLGDMATTLMWTRNYVSAVGTTRDLVFPCFVALAVTMGGLGMTRKEMKGELTFPDENDDMKSNKSGYISDRERTWYGNLVLAIGLAAIVSVPAFTDASNLPAFMGNFMGLGLLWILTDALHYSSARRLPTMATAVKHVDIETLIFFIGILLSVEALTASGIMSDLANAVRVAKVPGNVVPVLMAFASCCLDNVLLIAASMEIFPLERNPIDSPIWQLMSFCAGAGSNFLIVGSGAGIAFQSYCGVTGTWWMKIVVPWVLIGFGAGFGTYWAIYMLRMST